MRYIHLALLATLVDIAALRAEVNPQTIAVAGTLYVDLRAADFNADTATWSNRTGLGDFTVAVGAPVLTNDAAGTGISAVEFPAPDNALVGPTTVPDIEGNSDRSVEVWALNPSLAGEESMVAFGHRGTDRRNLTFNYSSNPSWGAAAHYGDDLGWGHVPAQGVWHHLVYTYDGSGGVKVYADGALANSKTLGAALDTFPGELIKIGEQGASATDLSSGQPFTGYIAAVRVHGGVLSPADVLNNYLLGINGTVPGALQGISLHVGSDLIANGFSQVNVTGDFANRTNVSLTALATLQSSDTNVFTVDANGVLQATGHGSATLTATFQGKQSTQTLQVLETGAAPVLKHRYSFTDAPGSTSALDSAGTANGTLLGGASFAGDGTLLLDGIDGYLDLPNGLLSSMTNVTFETWVTWNDPAQNPWQRIFDFGSSVNGEDQQGGGVTYFYLTPSDGGNLHFGTQGMLDSDQSLAGSGKLPLNQEIHLAVSYNSQQHKAALYRDGKLVSSAPVTVPLNTIDDVNNWLGRSQFNDPYFNGQIDEFRVYEGALNSLQIAASDVAGPDTVSIDPGAIQSLSLTLPATITVSNSVPSTLTASFASITNIALADIPGVTYQSSDTNVLIVDAKGQLTAAGVGTATVTALFQGKTDVKSVTVVPKEGLVTAGLLYVDLRASDYDSSTGIWTNHAGFGNFVSGATFPVLATDVAGTGVTAVEFDGAPSSFVGPLSNSDLDGNSDRSIEVWAYNPSLSQEETMVALGHRGSDKRNLSFNYGSNPGYGAAAHWANDIGWGAAEPVAGAWHYLVYTYDGQGTVKVYSDGALFNQTTIAGGINTFPSEAIKLGQQSDDGINLDPGQALTGYIAAVRVHGGLLSAADVLNNYLFGINATNPGPIQSITLGVSAPLYSGGFGQASVIGKFLNRTNVSLTSVATLTSSDTNIITVLTNGSLQAIGSGTAQIAAAFQGQQATQTVTVIAQQPAAQLKHRYSFNDTAGSTVAKDSADSADGTLVGGASLAGDGKVTLDGLDGYVDLPNGILSTLTNVTFEVWATWNDSAKAPWQRIFDFGSSVGGEDQQGGGITYFFLTPSDGGVIHFASQGIMAVDQSLTAPEMLPLGEESQLVVAYNADLHQVKFYRNGQLEATAVTVNALNTINDVNNWLGRSQFNDPNFNGQINEFRIWSGVLTDTQVSSSFAAGPDALPSTTSVSLSVSITGSTLQISWPDSATGYQLESTPALGVGASWTQVTTAPTQSLGQFTVSLPISSTGAQFFRLRK